MNAYLDDAVNIIVTHLQICNYWSIINVISIILTPLIAG